MTPPETAERAVYIVIPTFKRPEGLARAVRSVFAAGAEAGILVVDNDPAGSACEICAVLAAEAPAHRPLRYVHEPQAGVAHARNRAVAEVRRGLIAFLDDDQTAAPGWLDAFLSAQSQIPAAVTFGPIDAVLPKGTAHRAYLSDFFARQDDGADGWREGAHGAGNCLIDLSQVPGLPAPFDPAMNTTGGEDDVLFSAIARQGGRFAWAGGALAFEHVPPERARLGYALKRAFAYGQGPVTLARKAAPPRWDKVAFWMGVGAAKLAANSLLYAGASALRLDRRAEYLDRSVRGLGKLAWWVDLHFYGAPPPKSGRTAKAETPASSKRARTAPTP